MAEHIENDGEGVLFARDPDRTVELRGLVARDLIAVIDAVSIARHKTRMEVVIEWLQKEADRLVHESNLIQNVTRGNPQVSESVGGRAE